MGGTREMTSMKAGESETVHSRSELEIINRFAIDMLQSNNLDDLLWSIAKNVGQLLDFEDFVLYLLENKQLHRRAAFGPKARMIKTPLVIESGQGIVGAVAESGRAEVSADLSADPRYIMDEIAGHSEITVPVMYHGKVIAVFDAGSTQRNKFTDDDLRLLQTLANISATRIAAAQAEEHRDRTDELRRIQEDKYRLLAENIRDVIWTSDLRMRLTYISPSIERLTGYTPEEAMSLSMEEFYAAESLKAVTTVYKEEWQNEKSTADPDRTRRTEMQFKRKDGSTVWAETVQSFVRDDSGKPISIQGVMRDITERHKLEEAQRLSERKFRLFIEQSPDPIVIHDRTQFLFANVATLKLLGYEHDELLDVPMMDLILPDDLEIVSARTAILDKGGRPPSDVFRLRHKDGSVVLIEVHAHTTTFEGKEARIMMGRDITQRKAAEQALLRSEEQFRTLMSEIPDPVSVHQAGRLRLLFMNQAGLDLLGYRWDEINAMDILDTIHPDDHELFARRQSIFDRGEVPPIEELTLVRRDGTTVVCEVHAHATTFDGQEARIVVMRNTTERKKAEDALRRSEEQYRMLIEQMPDPVLIHYKGHALFMNQAMLNFLGYTRNEVMEIPMLDHIHPDDHPLVLRRQTEHERGKAPPMEEIRYLTRDGNIIVGDAHSFPITFDGYNARIAVIRDVTTRKKSEESADALRQQLEKLVEEKTQELKESEQQLRQSQKMEAVGQLAGGIAHDFNNILTVIIGYSNLHLKGLKPADPLHQGLSEIKKAGDRATTLTRQLLAFSSKQLLLPRVINLGTIVVEMQDMLHRLIGSHIQLEVRCNKNLQKVLADPGQIEQVIMNLLVNARDAIGKNGKIVIDIENVVLDASARLKHLKLPSGDYVVLSVADDGAGIQQEMLSHIFEPFYTTKEVDKGTGLGLSTVFGIVKQSGGEIQVQSELGNGSTFYIYLPAANTPVQVEEQTTGFSSPIEGKETLLVVEDEDNLRQLLKHTLAMFGYTVLVACDGKDALKVANKHQEIIDLMITDISMPEMTGYELARQIHPLRPDMPVLYISGHTEELPGEHGLVDSVKHFLQTPFESRDMAKKIRDILD